MLFSSSPLPRLKCVAQQGGHFDVQVVLVFVVSLCFGVSHFPAVQEQEVCFPFAEHWTNAVVSVAAVCAERCKHFAQRRVGIN